MLYSFDAQGTPRVWTGAAGNRGSGQIQPGETVWVQATGPDPALVLEQAPVGAIPPGVPPIGFSLGVSGTVGGVARAATVYVALFGGAPGHEPGDAYALAPMGAQAVVLGLADADGTLLALDAWGLDTDAPGHVDLVAAGVDGNAVTGDELTLSFGGPDGLPDDWGWVLEDRRTGTEVDLWQDVYAFELDPADGLDGLGASGAAPLRATAAPRFRLRFGPGVAVGTGAAPETGARLSPPQPNPAGRGASVRVRLDAPGPLRLSVVDALGREVARVADGVLPAGEHRFGLGAAALPAGTYAVRLVAGGRVTSRPWTVAR